MRHKCTHYMLNAGLQWYKEWVTKGFDEELKQIHDKKNFEPIKKSTLTQ